MDSKKSLKDQRDGKLRILRLQSNQSSMWQGQLLELVEELNNDCLKLRVAYGQLLKDVETLKAENITA